MSSDTQTAAPMTTALVQLRAALEQVTLPLDLPDVEQLRQDRLDAIEQLDDYILPRMLQMDAPLLTVVGGSTGAGKSTLVNSLVGDRVTEPGVLRPTTRSPVLVHHPQDASWFSEATILPGLRRTSGASNDPGSIQLVASTAIPQGLAVLDAPDIDSVEEQNRQLAAQLLAAADLWLFVTSAARYADQVPWEFLAQATERSTAVAIVLDRTSPEAMEEVRSHLARMMTARGLRDSPLFTVPEMQVNEDGILPSATVKPIRDWLSLLARDTAARKATIQQTVDGAIRSISSRAHNIAEGQADQVRVSQRLRGEATVGYERAVSRLDAAISDGQLLRGEVLARWQDFIGNGEVLKSLESRVSRVRDRIGRALRGQPQQAAQVSVAVEVGLQALLTEEAEKAAEWVAAAWGESGSGQQLLAASSEDLGRASRGFARQAEMMVAQWQASVLERVRVEGADKRTTARFLAYGVNGLAVSLMVVAFGSTGGITGAEVGIAGGAAVVGQKLLEAIFGDQAVRRLTAAVREDLQRRIAALMETELARYEAQLDRLGVQEENAERLKNSIRQVDDVRYRVHG